MVAPSFIKLIRYSSMTKGLHGDGRSLLDTFRCRRTFVPMAIGRQRLKTPNAVLSSLSFRVEAALPLLYREKTSNILLNAITLILHHTYGSGLSIHSTF